MKTKKLGRLYSPDVRDQSFMMVRRLPPAGTILPSRKTWRINPNALNQGQSAACVGHAWANFLRAVPIQTNKGIDDLRWKIYDIATQHDQWPQNDNDTRREFGTSIRAGAEAMIKLGHLKSYLWSFTLQPALEWVLGQGPVVLGVNWYSSMFRPNEEGLVRITPQARLEGGHAVLWRGADTRKGLASCDNSWGDNWGRSGNFFISFRDLERLIHEDGEACTATEVKIRSA